MPQPGEVSLAHHGVLFLDELTEYRRDVLEGLRQPLEDRWVTVARARSTLSFPAAFQLIAAANPCPCGHLGDDRRQCTCTLVCRDWLAEHSQGEPQDFCPNANLFRAIKGGDC